MIQYSPTADGGLKFVVPWKNSGSKFIFFFGLFWFVLVTMMMGALAKAPAVALFGIIFLGFFELIGIALLVAGILPLINKRQILITKDFISVSDFPLWTKKITRHPCDQIKNLSIRRRSNGTVNDRPIFSQAVFIHPKDGKSFKLCGAPTVQDAVFIERTIENFLGIEDDKSLDHFIGL